MPIIITVDMLRRLQAGETITTFGGRELVPVDGTVYYGTVELVWQAIEGGNEADPNCPVAIAEVPQLRRYNDRGFGQ
jgi:hypothetical protein